MFGENIFELKRFFIPVNLGNQHWVIVTPGLASKSIALVKLVMFRLLDTFTVVSELKNAVQEAWRFIVPGDVFVSMKYYHCGWL